MCTVRLLTLSQHALCRGVSAQGVSAWGCLPLVPWGCVSQHAMGKNPPPRTDWHLWKHNLRKLCLRVVNIRSNLYTNSLLSMSLDFPIGLPHNVPFFCCNFRFRFHFRFDTSCCYWWPPHFHLLFPEPLSLFHIVFHVKWLETKISPCLTWRSTNSLLVVAGVLFCIVACREAGSLGVVQVTWYEPNNLFTQSSCNYVTKNIHGEISTQMECKCRSCFFVSCNYLWGGGVFVRLGLSFKGYFHLC